MITGICNSANLPMFKQTQIETYDHKISKLDLSYKYEITPKSVISIFDQIKLKSWPLFKKCYLRLYSL